MTRQLADRISRRFESRFLREYVRWKLISDPVYPAAVEKLRGRNLPLLDIGCGIGLLALFLRESGIVSPLLGIDLDPRKIDSAKKSCSDLDGVSFRVEDAKDQSDFRGSVMLLDVLHYLDDASQRNLLEGVAENVPPGGVLVIRDCINDGSWRYRATYVEESFANLVGWLRFDKLNFPRLETIVTPFRSRGFREEIRPLWGRLPFNNYLLAFERPLSS